MPALLRKRLGLGEWRALLKGCQATSPDGFDFAYVVHTSKLPVEYAR